MTEEPGRLRIAWSLAPPRALVPPQLHDEARNAVLATGDLLASLGHRVTEKDPDWGGIGNNVVPRYLAGIAADEAEVPHRDRLERRTRGFASIGRLIPKPILERGIAQEASDRERIGAIFKEFDVLMTPVMAGTAIPIRRWEGQGALRTMIGMSRFYPYAVPWNHLGNPAASVPAGYSDDGMPLAVQLIARPGDEMTLLRLASQIERERPWADRLPPIR